MSLGRGWVGLLVAAILVAPLAGAYHYSVGSQDAVGVAPEESPGEADTSTALYERGTQRSCEQRSQDVEDAAQALAQTPDHDPFCGRLVYHQGHGFEQLSPPDQQVVFDGWRFDVVATQYVGTYELDTCYPWCAPGGVTVLDAVEDTLQTIAPGVFQGDHEDEEDHGHQSYAVDVRFTAAGTLLQRGTEHSLGSGWMIPTTDPTFVGFLQDDEGRAVDQGRLDTIVREERGGALPMDAAPLVCGFSPDFEGGGPTEDAPLTASVASPCDVAFAWRGGASDATFGPEEDDRCASATYVCGTMRPAWYGQLACKGWAGCQPAEDAGDAWHSSYDYDVWHFVVAPVFSACNGAQEPGFRTTTEGSADLPFLAHDLDVFTPPTSRHVEAAPGELPSAWAGQLSGPVTDGVGEGRIDPAQDAHEAMEAYDAPPPVTESYERVHKMPIPEPNAKGDTSKSVTISRTGDDCDAILAEGEDHIDPWVNQIDTRQRYWTWNGMHANQVELYGQGGESQDQNNRPGPGFYLRAGLVGMFADRDDDGDYEQASPEAIFSDIHAVGAYPMFYDMRLDQDLQPSGGCVADFAQRPIAEAMAEAGYGPRTGLIEAVYLNEPTVLFDRRTSEAYPFPGGETVFVAKTQAIKDLESAGDNDVEDAIADTIAATGAPDDAEVVDLHDVVPQESDFWEQCGEPTGRYVQELMFYHDCSLDCSGDTIATTYLFEVTSADGVIGGGAIPAFQPDGKTPYAFGQGVHTWTDVDPFDDDPDRNTRDGTPEH